MSFDPVNGPQMRQNFDFDFDLLDKLLQGINRNGEELVSNGSVASSNEIINPVPGTTERNLRLGSAWLRQLDQDMASFIDDDTLSVGGQSVSSSPAPGGNVDDFFDQEWNDISSFFSMNSISPSPSPQDIFIDPFKSAAETSPSELPRSGEALALNRELQHNLRIILDRLGTLNHQQHELARVTSLLQKQTDKKFKRKNFDLPFWPHQIPSLTLLNKVLHDANLNPSSNAVPMMDQRLVDIDNKLRQYYANLRMSPRWSYKERTMLAHAVRAQNEKILLGIIQEKGTHSLEECRNIIASFSEVDMLMNVNGIDWETVSKVFVMTRTPFDCRLQWTIVDHPMINKAELLENNDEEIEKLKSIVPKAFKQINSSKGELPDGFCSPWQLIASQLGTNRTAIQCFMMYQRRINPNFLKGKWTPEEDKLLVSAVKNYGTQNWQGVAQMMDGRTGQQCLHRYEKAINPEIKRGRWDKAEDELLRKAVEPFLSSKSKIIWSIVRLSIPGRTDVQCRERWVNVLDPSISAAPFSASEDAELLKLVDLNGTGNWSKIAHEFSSKRTDNQLWRRWKQICKSKRSSKQRKAAPKKRKSV